MDYELHPHPVGRWLLQAGGRYYGLDPDMGQRLLETGPDPDLFSRLEKAAISGNGRAIRLRLTVLRSHHVAAIAGKLRSLAGWRVLMAQAVFGLTTTIIVAATGGLVRGVVDPPALVSSLPLLLLLNLVHEFGHASALCRSGYPPGRIGLGWLLLLPVLFCDVSAVGLLGRSERLRVDIAGVCVQLAGIGGLALMGIMLDTPIPGLVAFGGLMSVAWSLLPVMKVDGYWLLCDALGIKSLDTPLPAGSPLVHRLARSLYRFMNLLIVLRIIWFAVDILCRFAPRLLPIERPAACAAGLLLFIILVGWGIRVFRAHRKSPSGPRA